VGEVDKHIASSSKQNQQQTAANINTGQTSKRQATRSKLHKQQQAVSGRNGDHNFLKRGVGSLSFLVIHDTATLAVRIRESKVTISCVGLKCDLAASGDTSITKDQARESA
jgi:hypothetical protein